MISGLWYNPADFTAAHAVCATGYNQATRTLYFLNNWGRQWGANGFGSLSYDYFSRYVSDAWTSFYFLGHQLPPPTDQPFTKHVRIRTNVLGDIWAAIDLWDSINDVRVAWCFMTHREDFLEIEDLFVRPEFSNSTHQNHLFNEILNFAKYQALPIRYWIPHADVRSCATNFATANSFIRFANLNVRKSPFTWAAYLGEQREGA